MFTSSQRSPELQHLTRVGIVHLYSILALSRGLKISNRSCVIQNKVNGSSDKSVSALANISLWRNLILQATRSCSKKLKAYRLSSAPKQHLKKSFHTQGHSWLALLKKLPQPTFATWSTLAWFGLVPAAYPIHPPSGARVKSGTS